MSIRPLDEWASARTQSLPLSALKGAVVGIDASHYISQHLLHHSTREPLLVALGGFPFALKTNIERELQSFKELGVACLFVFNGLEFGKKDQRPHVQTESLRAFEQAWELYDQQQADQVVDAFSGAGTPRPESLYRFLQRILYQNGVDFIVAPYSAAAQVRKRPSEKLTRKGSVSYFSFLIAFLSCQGLQPRHRCGLWAL